MLACASAPSRSAKSRLGLFFSTPMPAPVPSGWRAPVPPHCVADSPAECGQPDARHPQAMTAWLS